MENCFIAMVNIIHCRKRDKKLQQPVNPYTMAVEVDALHHDSLCHNDSTLPFINNHIKLKEGEFQPYRYRLDAPISPLPAGIVVETIKPTDNSDSGSSGELVPPPYVDGMTPARHGVSTFRQDRMDDHVYESPP